MKKLLVVLAGALMLAGCAREYEQQYLQQEVQTLLPGDGIAQDDVIAGVLHVKVTPERAQELEKFTDDEGVVTLTRVKSLPASGFTGMTRLFPPAGKFEQRHRDAGLHLWYVLEFSEETPLTKVAEDLEQSGGFEIIEARPRYEIVGNPKVTSYVEPSSGDVEQTASGITFNDPLAKRQWHYYNNGSGSTAVSGCDINVVPVWDLDIVGGTDIIVAVTDGGVDYSHEDLADNMWHNPEGKNDGVYGYNFVSKDYVIHPEDHGTHVAGTIAAVNNNNTGVCGIAGGNGKKKGVKIMSCQVFDGSKQGGFESSFTWAADHGAVISQNSWGVPGANGTPGSLRAAVDYFVKNAGVDVNGNQTGPIKGGIVCFASGNDNLPYSYCDYEGMVTVTSVGPDFRRAYYSNYGSYADIAAPGGDYKKGMEVLSTLPKNRYGNMQGTSMACPHVSGVTALIIAKYGGKGVTAESIKKRLLGATTDISSFTKGTYMGKGLVNAYKAIAGTGGKAPETPTNLEVSVKTNTLNFSVTVPDDSDEKDRKPVGIYILYSEEDFTNAENVPFAMFYTEDVKRGETLSGSVPGLDFDKTYYVAAQAVDLSGNVSGISARKMVNTTSNNAPKISLVGDRILEFKPHETGVFEFVLSDPDDHFVRLELHSSVLEHAEPGVDPGIAIDSTVYAHPKVTISGPKTPSGTYRATAVVFDAYGMSSSLEIVYTVLKNHAPKVGMVLEDIIYTSKAPVTTQLKTSDYFIDEDGEVLSYDVQIDNPAVFNIAEAKGMLNLTPMSYGYCNVTVTASDVRNETATQSFRVLVRDGKAPLDVYPNPVIDNIYVRTAEESSARVQILNSVGATIVDETVSISAFEPAKVDMKSCPSGVYSVVVTYNGETIVKSVVKI